MSLAPPNPQLGAIAENLSVAYDNGSTGSSIRFREQHRQLRAPASYGPRFMTRAAAAAAILRVCAVPG